MIYKTDEIAVVYINIDFLYPSDFIINETPQTVKHPLLLIKKWLP